MRIRRISKGYLSTTRDAKFFLASTNGKDSAGVIGSLFGNLALYAT
jgi:hypothetical protein